jgi:hypothetical protein
MRHHVSGGSLRLLDRKWDVKTEEVGAPRVKESFFLRTDSLKQTREVVQLTAFLISAVQPCEKSM